MQEQTSWSHVRVVPVVLVLGFAVLAAQACDRASERIAGPQVEQVQPTASVDAGLNEPQTLSSANGLLDVTLTAATATIDIGGQPVVTTVFNGTYLPPTLRVKRGDLLRITLVNASGMLTNLHTHGFEVTPKGISDNIFRIAEMGGSLTYEYQIGANHPAGQFWYHPHVHGNASAQTKFGLSGLIIVEGMQEEIPALQGLPERVLILKDAQIDGTAIDTALEIGLNTTRTVNGLVNPTITMAPGETQFWRISNQSANLYYRLVLDGHTLHQVGRDGNHLNAMQSGSEVLLVPGSRADVVVQMNPGEGGQTFALSALAVQTGVAGDSYDAEVLATVSVEGTAVSPLDLSTITMTPQQDMRSLVTNARAVTFQQDRAGLAFLVNGQEFDMNKVNTRVKHGNVERWTVQNTTNEWHVFHIHQVQFQLVAVNGKPVPFDGYYDVVNVPEKGSVTVIIPFNAPTSAGKYVYHCHILDHEDRGMMAVIQVGKEDEPVAMSPEMASMKHGHGDGATP